MLQHFANQFINQAYHAHQDPLITMEPDPTWNQGLRRPLTITEAMSQHACPGTLILKPERNPVILVMGTTNVEVVDPYH